MNRAVREVLIVTSLMVIFGSCAGDGCSCAEPIKGGFPVAERHENVVQVRATDALFSFLESNFATILTPLLPGMGTFDIPSSCGGDAEICCGNPAPMCRLKITPKNLVVDPTPPNLLRVVFSAELKTMDKIPLSYDTNILGVAKCFIEIDTTLSSTPDKVVDLKTDATFSVDGASALTRLRLSNTEVLKLHESMIQISSQPGDFLCTLINIVPAIKQFALDQVKGQLGGQLESAVDDALCMKCMDLTDCNTFATECKDGFCVDSTDQCIQEIGIDGRIDLGGMLASFSPGLSAKTDFLLAAGGYVSVDDGLSLGMLGGAQGTTHAACVPVVAPPEPANVAPSRTYSLNHLPEKASPFHVGIGLHQTHLDRIGWAAFDAGALCLNIGTATVPQLSAGTIGLIIPSLVDLVQGDAPLFISLRPSLPPTFELGKGTFSVDAMGKKTVVDPLLHLSLPNLAIDFLAFVNDRYVRVMTLTSDLSVGVSLDVDADGNLVPLLGDLSSAFGNLRVSNSDLLAESPDSLRAAFPMLLALAVGQIGTGLSAIELPAIMGIQLTSRAVTSTDPDANGVNQFLGIFADLAVASQVQQRIDTRADLVALALPSTEAFSILRRQGQTAPHARISVAGSAEMGAPLEFSYRLDDGLWSEFEAGPELDVRDERLWIQMHHRLEVRARAVGRPDTLDATPAVLDLLVDTVAPTGSFIVDGSSARVTARDQVSKTEALRYRIRTDSRAAFSQWQSSPDLTIPSGGDSDSLEIEVSDEAVNVARLGLHGRTTSPTSASGCGCDLGAAGSRAPRGLFFALGALALLLYRRRALFALVFVLALGASACSSGSLQKGDYMNPLDQVGRYHDIVTRNGNFYVSAYDDTYGDLVFAEIKRLDQPIGWQYVDGIEDGVPPDMPGDYRQGVSESGPDVGRYTALALTQSGAPRIAYYDATRRSLKFAVGPHPWRVHTVDVGDVTMKLDVGRFAAISLDDRDIPAIAYMVSGVREGSTFKSELRIAKASSSSPAGPNDWTIGVVEQTSIPCGGRCSTGTACIMPTVVNMMPNGDPALSSCLSVDANPCSPACGNDDVCIAGSCVTPLAENKIPDLPEGTGLFAKVLRSKGNQLQILYHDRSQGDLKLALEGQSNQYTIALVDGGSPTTDVGQFVNVAVDGNGLLHVVYVDAISDRLLYKTVTGGVPSASSEVVDDGRRPDGQHSVGASAAIALSGDTLRVVYQDQTTSDLREARRQGGWASTAIDAGIAGYGFDNHLTWVGTSLYLSQFVYDRGAGSPIGNFALRQLGQ